MKMNENMNYYEVVAKCGHVGRKHYVPVKFAIIAESGKEAAKIARKFPRVKHDHKDAILNVTKIDYERFQEIKRMNNEDPYLKVHSKQEQNKIPDLDERMEIETNFKSVKFDRQARLDRIAFKNKKRKLMEDYSWDYTDCLDLCPTA